MGQQRPSRIASLLSSVLSLWLVLSAGACSTRVFIEAPAALTAASEELRSSLAAPRSRGGPGFRISESPGRADILLRMDSAWSGEESPEVPGEGYVLSREPYAPATEIGGYGSSYESLLRSLARAVSFDECGSGAVRVLPIEEILPPLVALPVSGKTVDALDYPLNLIIRVRPEARNLRGRASMTALRSSLESLETQAEDASGSKPGLIWVAAAGDMMTGRGIDRSLLAGGPGTVFGPEILRILENADLALANLEGALTRGGIRAPKTFAFRSPPEIAGGLAAAGFDVLLAANHHSMDWGAEGLLDTLKSLAGAGITGVGAGENLEDASQPYRASLNGQTAAVFGAARFPRERTGWDGQSAAAREGRAGIFWLDGEGLGRIRQAFQEEALDIVLVHGGEEWSRKPSPEFRRVVTELVEAGADAVIGSHPHVAQGMEWIRGKPAFWSLGNFVFPGMDGTPGGEEGLMIRAGFLGNRLLYLEAIPLLVYQEGVRAGRGPGG